MSPEERPPEQGLTVEVHAGASTSQGQSQTPSDLLRLAEVLAKVVPDHRTTLPAGERAAVAALAKVVGRQSRHA